MAKSATDVMQDVIFSAVVDAIVRLKAASGGLPNNLLRDLNAVHANTSFADLHPDVRAAIAENVRAAFARLLREGYAVAPSQPGRGASDRPVRSGPAPAPRSSRPAPRPGAPRGPRGGPRPPAKPPKGR